MAANLAPHHIAVNGVAAGLVRTATAAERTSEFFCEQTVQMQNIKRVRKHAPLRGSLRDEPLDPHGRAVGSLDREFFHGRLRCAAMLGGAVCPQGRLAVRRTRETA
ncbi:hypothetical protein ACFW93_46095 [Streptomyces canus]|uniref:hypothetical protein n=1 Tax=Streptomyces canus TaxID=58343 RepID=UPI0036C88D42